MLGRGVVAPAPLDAWIALAAVVMTVWIVLPALHGAPVYLAILTYILFVMFQEAASTTATEIMSFALLTILGSLCIYALTRSPEYGVEITSLLAIFGTTIYAIRRFLRRASHDALNARLRAERSEAALGVALAEVAGQRDAKARFHRGGSARPATTGGRRSALFRCGAGNVRSGARSGEAWR